MSLQFQQMASVLKTTKNLLVTFFTSSVFNRFYFFITALVLGICVLLVWLIILMAIKSGASSKVRDWLRAYEDPKKGKK